MNKIIIVIFILWSTKELQSQSIIISGEIENNIKDTAFLGRVIDNKYYAGCPQVDTLHIKNHQFSTSLNYPDTIPRPYDVAIEIKRGQEYFSYPLIYLNGENQKFNITKKGLFTNYSNKSLAMQVAQFNDYFQPFNKLRDSIGEIISQVYIKNNFNLTPTDYVFVDQENEKISRVEDSLLFLYVKNHPNSYPLFWRVVQKFNENGPNQKYINIFNGLSDDIKTSSVGKIFFQDIKISQTLSYKDFLSLKLKDINLNPISITHLGKSYTLIDFWYSHCQPCLLEMPQYKAIYSQYKNKGFEIIGISTDKTKYIEDWKKVIKEQELDWVQYLDENGIEADKLNINKFPTNFLLDSDGKIIQRDISQVELEQFLKTHLTP